MQKSILTDCLFKGMGSSVFQNLIISRCLIPANNLFCLFVCLFVILFVVFCCCFCSQTNVLPLGRITAGTRKVCKEFSTACVGM